MITPNQVRQARLALGWSRQRLAGASNTTANFIKIYEEQGRVARINLRQFIFNGLEAIEATMAEHGIKFDHAHDEARLAQATRSEFPNPAAERCGPVS